MKKMLILFIITLIGTSGCATMQSEYSCPGVPDGVVCKDPVEVYKLTDNADSVKGCKDCKHKNKEIKNETPQPNKKQEYMPVITKLDPTKPLHGPMPIMEAAKVLRVWIAPWIDEKEDLRWPGYVFTEVTPRRWTIGKYGFTSPTSLVPAAHTRSRISLNRKKVSN
ncbi:MAG: type IV conjugative transfer system lipoprotein TraV [Dissulfuribacterales bacterium]